MLDGGAAAVHGLHQWQKAQVKTQHLVFGVVGYPGNLVRVQARVDGVEHAARTTHTVVQLEMAVAVPGERGYAVAKCELQAIQRICNLARAHG